MEKIQERILLTDTFDVHQDWEVPIPGFFIVAAKNTSKKSIADFTDAETNELALTLKRVRTAMKEVLGIEVVYLFQNEDTVHGFHVWMFPRHEWMKQFGTRIQSVRPSMEFAQETMGNDPSLLLVVKDYAEKMRNALSN